MSSTAERLNRATIEVRACFGLAPDRAWREYIAARLDRIKDQMIDAATAVERDELAAQARLLRAIERDTMPTNSLPPNVTG